MSQESELRRLEQFVEKLLTRFSELRAEKSGLLQELQERDRQIEELRASLSSREMERSELSQRVSKIVEQIEEWELGLDGSDAVAGEADTVEETTEVAEENISQEDQVDAEQHEEEGRVQHNLFSLGTAHR